MSDLGFLSDPGFREKVAVKLGTMPARGSFAPSVGWMVDDVLDATLMVLAEETQKVAL